MVEDSPLNKWIPGAGRTGVITYGATTTFVQEVRTAYGADIDILSIAFTNPLPEKLIRKFHDSIAGDVYVFEDGYHYLQDELRIMGLDVKGKDKFSPLTEYSPALIARKLGYEVPEPPAIDLAPVKRPPMICAGCPYTLFANVIARLKRKKKIEVAFGDIGCNALLYFMGALDTGLAMGASESKRAGYVLSKPEMADKCVSILGDSTECHSGMDATRNSVFRNVPGVKIVLDNYWTAMTGGQPAPTSPVNLAGEPNRFDLAAALEATGTPTVRVDAYDRKGIQKSLRQALKSAAEGTFTTLVVRGGCIKKIPNDQKGIRLRINPDKCQKCHACQICPGTEAREGEMPVYNNLCTGCGGQQPACQQMCPFDAIEALSAEERKPAAAIQRENPPPIPEVRVNSTELPDKISLAIRGVGGQGNLFFGRVLTQLAFLSGYAGKNIVKGETHGMAQMGGPVISTFSCGKVHSPNLLPGEADCLIVMERSEILRPGFLELLKKNGVILAAGTKIVPQNLPREDYPGDDALKAVLRGYRVIEADVLGKAVEIGDQTGRSANVIMMGVLSRIDPFAGIPPEVWLNAIKKVSPAPALWAANHHAFTVGRELV